MQQKTSNFSKLCAKVSWTPPINSEGEIASCIAFGFIAVYLWVLPIDQTIALRHLAFFPLVLLTLWSAWRYKLRLHLPLTVPWLFYGAIALLSVNYAINASFSLGEAKKEIGYGMLILMVTATWVRNIASLERLFIILIIGNIVLIGSALFNVTIIHPFWRYTAITELLYYDNPKRLYGGIGDFSTYLVTVIPLIAAYTFMLPRNQRAIKFVLILLITLNAIVLFLTRSRMGMIALTAETIIGIGFLLANHAKILISRNIIIAIALTAITCALLAKLLQLYPPINDDRIDIWRNGITHIQSHPLTGSGFGRTVLKLVEKKANPHYSGYDHSHNMVINKGVQMGVPGMLAFLFLLGMTLRALWPRHTPGSDFRQWGYTLGATIMSLGVFIKSVTDDFFVNNNALLYWALVGGVLGALSENKRNFKARNNERIV